MSDSLRPHGLQHARIPCPSPPPRVFFSLCPLSQWNQPRIGQEIPMFLFWGEAAAHWYLLWSSLSWNIYWVSDWMQAWMKKRGHMHQNFLLWSQNTFIYCTGFLCDYTHSALSCSSDHTCSDSFYFQFNLRQLNMLTYSNEDFKTLLKEIFWVGGKKLGIHKAPFEFIYHKEASESG